MRLLVTLFALSFPAACEAQEDDPTSAPTEDSSEEPETPVGASEKKAEQVLEDDLEFEDAHHTAGMKPGGCNEKHDHDDDDEPNVLHSVEHLEQSTDDTLEEQRHTKVAAQDLLERLRETFPEIAEQHDRGELEVDTGSAGAGGSGIAEESACRCTVSADSGETECEPKGCEIGRLELKTPELLADPTKPAPTVD